MGPTSRKGRAFPHSRGRSPLKRHDRSLIWTAVGLALPLEFLHLCDGKDGLRDDAKREFPSLAPLEERDEIFVGASRNVETPDPPACWRANCARG